LPVLVDASAAAAKLSDVMRVARIMDGGKDASSKSPWTISPKMRHMTPQYRRALLAVYLPIVAQITLAQLEAQIADGNIIGDSHTWESFLVLRRGGAEPPIVRLCLHMITDAHSTESGSGEASSDETKQEEKVAEEEEKSGEEEEEDMAAKDVTSEADDDGAEGANVEMERGESATAGGGEEEEEHGGSRSDDDDDEDGESATAARVATTRPSSRAKSAFEHYKSSQASKQVGVWKGGRVRGVSVGE